MPSCLNCHQVFRWQMIYKSLWGWLYSPIDCEHCGTEHRITIPGRFIFVLLTILPMLIFMNFLTPFNVLSVVGFFSTIGIGILIFFIGSLLAPYLVKFKLLSS